MIVIRILDSKVLILFERITGPLLALCVAYPSATTLLHRGLGFGRWPVRSCWSGAAWFVLYCRLFDQWIYSKDLVYPIRVECVMQVSKWGNSLAVRLPCAVVEALALKEGDDIELQVVGSRDFEVAKAPDASELLRRLRKYRGRLPDSFRFDRLEAHERG